MALISLSETVSTRVFSLSALGTGRDSRAAPLSLRADVVKAQSVVTILVAGSARFGLELTVITEVTLVVGVGEVDVGVVRQIEGDTSVVAEETGWALVSDTVSAVATVRTDISSTDWDLVPLTRISINRGISAHVSVLQSSNSVSILDVVVSTGMGSAVILRSGSRRRGYCSLGTSGHIGRSISNNSAVNIDIVPVAVVSGITLGGRIDDLGLTVEARRAGVASVGRGRLLLEAETARV
jgi:hypothetical protein